MRRLSVIVVALTFTAPAQAQDPPAISHPIDGYVVTRQENNCLECHDKPHDIGKKRAKGLPSPAPASHYGKLEGKAEVASTHFICTSCHASK